MSLALHTYSSTSGTILSYGIDLSSRKFRNTSMRVGEAMISACFPLIFQKSKLPPFSKSWIAFQWASSFGSARKTWNLVKIKLKINVGFWKNQYILRAYYSLKKEGWKLGSKSWNWEKQPCNGTQINVTHFLFEGKGGRISSS